MVCWSSISRFSATCPSFIIRLGTRLKELQVLSLLIESSVTRKVKYCHGSTLDYDIRAALLKLPDLKELELTNRSGVLDEELIAHLGQSLKKLHVEHRKPLPIDRELLSFEQIKWLGLYGTSLQQLRIDIPMQPKMVSQIVNIKG